MNQAQMQENSFMNNLFELDQSGNDYLSFLRDEIQPSETLVHSSEYFGVFHKNEGQKKGQQKKERKQSYLKVKLEGLLNPKLNILQVYRLLNPYDIMVKESYVKISQISENKIKNQNVRTYISQLWSLNKQREQRVNGKEKTQQPTYRYSMFFLYYIKKLFNWAWRRHQLVRDKVSQQRMKGIKKRRQQEIQGFQLRLVCALYEEGLFSQDVVKQLFKVLEIEDYPITEQQQGYHLGMEHFLLYKLYKIYGVESQWSELYEEELHQIEYGSFVKLYDIEQRVNPCTMDSCLVGYEIWKLLESYRENKPAQIGDNQISVLKGYADPQQCFGETGVGLIIGYLISNLQNYSPMRLNSRNYCGVLDLFALEAREGKDVNLEMEVLPRHKKMLRDMLGVQEVRQKFWCRDVSINLSQTTNYQPIYMYQTNKLASIFQRSSDMFDKLMQIIIDYYTLFGFVFDHQTVKKNMFYLNLNSRTLMWNQANHTFQIDKLEVWKLLFGVERCPLTVEQAIVFMAKNQITDTNLVVKAMKNIVNKNLQPIKIIGNKKTEEQQRQRLSKTVLFLIPFISLISLAYEIFQKSSSAFIKDLSETYQSERLQKNIEMLVQDMFELIVGKMSIKEGQTQMIAENIGNSQKELSKIDNKLRVYTDQLSNLLSTRIARQKVLKQLFEKARKQKSPSEGSIEKK